MAKFEKRIQDRMRKTMQNKTELDDNDNEEDDDDYVDDKMMIR